MDIILQPFSLVLMRLTPFFMAVNLSLFGRFPAMVRLVTLLVVTIIFVSVVPYQAKPMAFSEWGVLLAFEFVLGLLLLTGFQLIVSAIQIMGRVLDMQIGFAAAGVVDPNTNNNDPLLGHIYTLFFMLLVFVTDTHHALLLALSVSFSVLPLGEYETQLSVYTLFSYFSTQMTLAGLLLLPVVAGLWLMDIFNGVLSKSMPQMNVYFVMLPLKILIGLLIISASVEHIKPIIEQFNANMIGWFTGQGLR